MLASSCSTWVDLLDGRANAQPDKRAFIFLQNGESESASLTYFQLQQRSQTIAAYLQSFLAKGDRVLLLYPPGLDFVCAFLGCLYAGVVAVPADLPRPKRPLSRVRAIVADAQVSAILTVSSVRESLTQQSADLPDLATQPWVSTDQLTADGANLWQNPQINPQSLAFLQYTSGSTGIPKGVKITHANLLHNQQSIQQAFGHTEQTIFVGWLPLFHDMGLIGNVLQPLYLGIPSILMPPLAFLQRPWRWLQAISRYRATTSGAPNFAYDLCVRKTTPEQRATLDLSCWEVAFNGAEPVRAETLERFAATFAPWGFRPEAFYPCYGLAEATLFITGGIKTAMPVIQTISGAALAQNRAVPLPSDSSDRTKDGGLPISLVSCGRVWGEQVLKIVEPDSCTPCQPKEVGEIWVRGASVASGYWNRPQETQQTFQAQLADIVADSEESCFLRTGDLGFIQDGELFITGRLKDVIIFKGQNYYPQDLEWSAFSSHNTFRLEGTAAFTVDVAGVEQLVILQEVERQFLSQLDNEQAIAAIAAAVMADHDLRVYEVWLLKPGSLPKTSSGKLQRYLCRQKFLARTLEVVAEGGTNLSLGRNR